MSSDNDRRDARLRDSRKESPDRWGKGGRHDSDAATETNRNDPQSIRCRVFIGNLPSEMSSKELKETFSQYGPVVGVSVHNNFGFVQFEDDKSADSSVAKEHGKVYYGKRVDVNLAGDRRKPNKMDDRPRDRDSRPPFPFRREREFDRDGRPFRRSPPRERPRFEDYDRFPSRFEPPFERRGRSPSPPPPRRMDDRPGYGRHDDYYMRDRYRDEPPHHREPYPRQSYDHRGDAFDRDRRDPYDSPRGPYPDRRDDRYERYDSYGRDYPRPDDYPGAAKRPRMDYNDRPEDSYSSSKTIEAPTDCVIVVMNKQQRGYAEMVERRLKALGLVVELHFHGTQPITELLDDVARRGVLYAIVITSQHEIHRSVTVNILHGNPQGKDQNLLARIKKHTEHRNMPLDDAMRLVGQNFDQYMQDLRERAKSSSTQESSNTKTTAPQDTAKSDITSLLSKAASGEDLSADQLTKLIDNLSKRQEQILGDSAAANGKGGVTVSQSSQPAVDPQSIAKQQADLQAKILSILNPGGGAKTGSMQNSGSLASQQTILPTQKQGAVTAPASQGAAKPASLSTTVKPIFPLYPTQQKPAAPAASTAGSAVKAPGGTAAAKPLYSTPSNQAYKTASPYRATAPASSYNAIATVAGNQAGSYQVSKPVSQNTYTSVSNQATAASASSAVYGVKTSAAPASQSNWLQRISQQSSGTSAAIPVVSKVSPGGKAITTAVGSRPAVNSAPRAGAPTAVGGVRPVPTAGGQMRTPSPGLLGPPPVGTPRFRTSGIVRTSTSSGTPGVRMVAPRGPSPVGRGVVRTSSPAGLQGQTVASRGGAISVRGGVAGAGGTSATGRGSFATQATTPRGGSAQRGAVIVRGTPTPRGATRGVPATRGAPSTRGVPLARGVPVARGAPATRGAPAPRGAPVSSSGARGTPVTRGTPYLRGAPTGRGTLATRGSPIGTITSNRGAPRGRPMMRGGPPYRGGGRGGY